VLAAEANVGIDPDAIGVQLRGWADLLVDAGIAGLALLALGAVLVLAARTRGPAPGFAAVVAAPAGQRPVGAGRRPWGRPRALLDPVTRTGMAVSAPLAVLVLVGAAFSVVSDDVVERNNLVALDEPLARLLIAHRGPAMTAALQAITNLGDVVMLMPLLLTIGLLARWRHGSWRLLGFAAISLAGARLTSTVIKLLVARPRPGTGALVAASGYGFPSGHATAAAAGWLSAALVIGSLTRRVAVRIAIAVTGILLVVLVGVSRVYLGVHQATDVLGGWMLGVLWPAAVLTANGLANGKAANAFPAPACSGLRANDP